MEKEIGPPLPPFFRKNVILKVLCVHIAQECDSKRVVHSLDSNSTRPASRSRNVLCFLVATAEVTGDLLDLRRSQALGANQIRFAPGFRRACYRGKSVGSASYGRCAKRPGAARSCR